MLLNLVAFKMLPTLVLDLTANGRLYFVIKWVFRTFISNYMINIRMRSHDFWFCLEIVEKSFDLTFLSLKWIILNIKNIFAQNQLCSIVHHFKVKGHRAISSRSNYLRQKCRYAHYGFHIHTTGASSKKIFDMHCHEWPWPSFKGHRAIFSNTM